MNPDAAYLRHWLADSAVAAPSVHHTDSLIRM
jgi:hypothetical protein